MVRSIFCLVVLNLLLALSLTGCLAEVTDIQPEEPPDMVFQPKGQVRIPKALAPANAATLAANLRSNQGLVVTSTKLGNSVEYVIANAIGPGPLLNVLPEKNLVQSDVLELRPGESPYDGSNWILTGGIAVVTPAQASNVDQFKVRVQFGSGGILQEFSITPSPQFSLNLPSNTVKVSVYCDKLHTGRFINPGRYVFQGMIHRGQAGGHSFAKLVTFEDDVLPGSVVGNVSVGVPQYARRLQLMGDDAGDLYGAGALLTFEPSGLRYTGPELLALKNAAKLIDIPGGSIDIRFQGGLTALAPVFSWDIDV